MLAIVLGDGNACGRLAFERIRGEDVSEACGECLGDGNVTGDRLGDGLGDERCGGNAAMPVLGDGKCGNPPLPNCGEGSADVLALGDPEIGGGGFLSKFIILLM